MSTGFFAHFAHFKYHIPLLDEGNIQVAAVDTYIAGGADCSGRRIQDLHLCCHILVCRNRHGSLVSGCVL